MKNKLNALNLKFAIQILSSFEQYEILNYALEQIYDLFKIIKIN